MDEKITYCEKHGCSIDDELICKCLEEGHSVDDTPKELMKVKDILLDENGVHLTLYCFNKDYKNFLRVNDFIEIREVIQ